MATGNVDPALLRSIQLFARASAESLQRLAAASSLLDVPPRATLIDENAAVKTLHTMVEGAVELLCERAERRFTLCVARGVKPLMLCAVLTGRSPFSARTLEPCRFVVTPAKLMLELIGCDCGLAQGVLQEVSDRWLRTIENFKAHRLLTTSERVADWILMADASNGGTGEIVMPFGKRVLASYLGMAPEQLSRHFAALAAAGVSVQGRHISFANRAALEAIAEGSTPH
jgi:CRP/FNR family transcriptional regulator, transcriptional activator FtrB